MVTKPGGNFGYPGGVYGPTMGEQASAFGAESVGRREDLPDLVLRTGDDELGRRIRVGQKHVLLRIEQRLDHELLQPEKQRHGLSAAVDQLLQEGRHE